MSGAAEAAGAAIRARSRDGSVLVIGVGNALRGDDAAGLEVVRRVPDELQIYSDFTWTAGVMRVAQQPVAGAALVKFLASSKAALVMKKMSMEPAAF